MKTVIIREHDSIGKVDVGDAFIHNTSREVYVISGSVEGGKNLINICNGKAYMLNGNNPWFSMDALSKALTESGSFRRFHGTIEIIW